MNQKGEGQARKRVKTLLNLGFGKKVIRCAPQKMICVADIVERAKRTQSLGKQTEENERRRRNTRRHTRLELGMSKKSRGKEGSFGSQNRKEEGQG